MGGCTSEEVRQEMTNRFFNLIFRIPRTHIYKGTNLHMRMASNVESLQAPQAATQVLYKVDLDTLVTVLDMGVKFCYQIPSFSVLYVDLRQVKVQLHREDTSTIVNAFIRADPMLDKVVPPFCITLNEFCFVLVSTRTIIT